jgi:hypothetical protein
VQQLPKDKMNTVTITITKVSGGNIYFNGLPVADSCHVSNFPNTPKVGEKYRYTYSDSGKVVSIVKM